MGRVSSFVVKVAAAVFVAQRLAWAGDGLLLAEHGRSSFVIYHAPEAPASVKDAASELRTYMRKVTGADLPVVAEFRKTKTIALGQGPHLGKLGLDLKGLKPEGYRIITRGEHLCIYGLDTLDGGTTPEGGFSRGTQNGVYTFIERSLGVRWVIPGPDGESVPRRDTLRLPDTDLTEAPSFRNRRLPYIGNRRPPVERWMLRQKLGYSIELRHYHHWQRIVPKELYAEHPEFFAWMGGRRVKPLGDRYKLCTTQPGLVRHVADQVKASFRENPIRLTFSVSPTDGRGWCECENCRALDEVDAGGKRHLARRIVTFYNEVAEIVAREFPGKYVCGYVYADYERPPQDPRFKVHPNVYLVWASSMNYGMTHFRPEVRDEWHRRLAQWRRIAPRLSYYDLANKLSQTAGAPNPPCRKILKSMLPALKRAGVEGVYLYGIEAWGHGAALNYMTAKLMWDAEADVDALYDEFFRACYGKAWLSMKSIYDLLETALESQYKSNPELRYRLGEEVLKDVYARAFPQVETLYGRALTEVDEGPPQRRLEMFHDNMVKLCFTLRTFGWLKQPEGSIFYLSDEDYYRFLIDNQDSLALQVKALSADNDRDIRRIVASNISALPHAGKISHPERMRTFRFRRSQHLLCRVETDRDVTFHVRLARKRGHTVQYAVYDASGEKQTEGIAAGQTEARFPARAGEVYHVLLRTNAIFYFRMLDTPYVVNSRHKLARGASGAHFLGSMTPLYFYVPATTKRFTVTLHTNAPGETARAVLVDPANRETETLRTVQAPVDSKTIENGAGVSGFWRLDVTKAEKGYLDDVWIQIGEELPGWFSLDPRGLLIVKETPK